MIVIGRGQDQRRRLMTRLADVDLSYPEVGMTEGGAPTTYHQGRYRMRIGRGDDVFDRAVSGLRAWVPQRALGFRIESPGADQRAGSTVALLFPLGLAYVVVPCRVVRRIDDGHRQGYAYGTLAGHPECGEESFLVERDIAGDVWFTVEVASRPGLPVVAALAPVARAVQRLAIERYLRVLRRHATWAVA